MTLVALFRAFCKLFAEPAAEDFAHIYHQRRTIFKIRCYDSLVYNTSFFFFFILRIITSCHYAFSD